MFKQFFPLIYLLIEVFLARRDARIRFLKLQVAILRHKTRGGRVIISPKDRTAQLQVGGELNNNVKEILTPLEKKMAYCLFFIHLQSRKVFASPVTYHPDGRWVKQRARNVHMWLDDAGVEARFLLRDRDAKFTLDFDRMFRDAGTRIVKTPVQYVADVFSAACCATTIAIQLEIALHFRQF